MSEQSIAASTAIVEGQLFSTKVNGEAVIVTRISNKLKAYSAKCPHMGLPLASGKVANGTLTCKFHGAEFDLATGNNILAMGKKPCGLKHYNVSERDGKVYVSVQA